MPLKVRVPFARALLPLLLLVSASAMADSVPELRALVDANDASAWEMAQRMEPDNAGDAEFDFWYGLAAKAAGNKQQAVFAFERVVLSQPANARAKLELADAYAAYGNTREAKRLFNEVLATTPPEPVQQRIRTYLGALDTADKSRSTRIAPYFTLSGGYDSNISSATDDGNQFVPLSPQSLERDTGFVDAILGVDVVNPVNQRDSRFLSASIQRHDNADIFSGGNFDYSQATVTAGWLAKRGSVSWRVPVTLQALWVESDTGPAVPDANDDRYVMLAGLERNRMLSSRTAVTMFGQLGNMHYPSEETRNAWVAFVGGAYVWQSATSPLRLTSIVRLGTEPTEESVAEFNGRDYLALRLNARWTLSATQALYGAIGLQQSNYQAEHPFLLLEREDTLADVTMGWQWQLDPAWTVNVDLSHADNNSADNTLYDFNRTQFKLGSTWRF